MKRISLVAVAEMCTNGTGTLSFKLLISKSQGKARVAKGGGEGEVLHNGQIPRIAIPNKPNKLNPPGACLCALASRWQRPTLPRSSEIKL